MAVRLRLELRTRLSPSDGLAIRSNTIIGPHHYLAPIFFILTQANVHSLRLVATQPGGCRRSRTPSASSAEPGFQGQSRDHPHCINTHYSFGATCRNRTYFQGSSNPRYDHIS